MCQHWKCPPQVTGTVPIVSAHFLSRFTTAGGTATIRLTWLRHQKSRFASSGKMKIRVILIAQKRALSIKYM